MTQALRKMRCAAWPRSRACSASSNSDGRAPADAHSPSLASTALLVRRRRRSRRAASKAAACTRAGRLRSASRARCGPCAPWHSCARVLLTATLVVTPRVSTAACVRPSRVRVHTEGAQARAPSPFATSALTPKPALSRSRSHGAHQADCPVRCAAHRLASSAPSRLAAPCPDALAPPRASRAASPPAARPRASSWPPRRLASPRPPPAA